MSDPSSVLLGASNRARMRHRLMLRIVALAGLAAVCLTFPQVGENRFVMAALLLALTPVPAVLPRFMSPERWMVAQSIFDVAATVLLIGFLPDVWAAGLVIVVCSPAASSALLGRRTYITLEVFGLAGIAVAAMISGAEGWQVPFAVGVLMVPLVASYVDVFLAHQITAAAHLDDVAQSSSAVFWEIDATTGEFLAVSGRIEEVLGYRPEEVPGHLPSLLVEDDREKFWRRVQRNDGDQFVTECRAVRNDGEVVWLRLHVRRMNVRGVRVLRGIAFDITELVEVHEEVRRRAEVDDLTGLANRSVLVTDLEKRLQGGAPFSLHVLDLDRFKDINDTLGHIAGDEFLRAIAGRLAAASPEGSVVARMGGDEFAVVADSSGGIDGVMALARRLSAVCEAGVDVGGLEFVAAASCGVAVAPLHGSTAEDLLRRGDLAMYEAKRLRTGVHLFDFASNEADVDRLKLSAEAGAALTNGQMHLWFQPKVDLASGAVVGAEALLRWHHPRRGVLLPGEFLDVLELSRYRERLCSEVLAQGVAFAERVSRREREFQVAVNVSVRDLADPGFANSVTGLLNESRLRPDQLVVEITERDIMDDRTGFERAATAVRSTGIELAIDDFGTGHSSLLRLHQLPVTELKIDRSFVSGLSSDPEAGIIVRSIVELGRALGHRVVAEGVERPSEVDVLRELGCGVGQGFLFAAALPADDFAAMLDAPEVLLP